MENEKLNISQEMLDNLSIEQLADLKIEAEELLLKLEEVIETSNAALNS